VPFGVQRLKEDRVRSKNGKPDYFDEKMSHLLG
jgi:hypothetical protein